METIILSIITINFNDNEGVQKTIESIKQQKYNSYEHIIIDGGSTDKSKETIAQYAKSTTHLSYWVSEKDNGIYNAMNKGIAQASGQYLLFLNSGDYLEPDILDQIKNQITGEDIIYGDLYFVSNEGERRLQTFDYPDLNATRVIRPDFCIPHPASLIKRDLFKEEPYNEQYKIVSDWEFFVKNIILKNCTTKHLAIAVSNFVDGGVSSLEENRTLMIREREEVLRHLFPQKILDSLNKLSLLEQSPLCEAIIKVNQTSARTQKRMKKIVLFYYNIHSLFTKRKPTKR